MSAVEPVRQAAAVEVRLMLERLEGQVGALIPDPARFLRTVWTVCRANPQLLASSPASLAACILNAAQIGLEPGPLGHVYIVPFKNHGVFEATLIVGYKGYVDLARRAGQSVVGRAVYEGDDFAYGYGTDEFIRHRPTATDRGELTFTYAVARGSDGTPPSFVVLSRADIEARRRRSRAANNGPWVSDHDPMAIKTSVRALVPWLRISAELARAEAVDETAAGELPVGLGLASEGLDLDTIDGGSAVVVEAGGDQG